MAAIVTPLATIGGGTNSAATDPGPATNTPTQENSVGPSFPVPRSALLTAGELPLPTSKDTTYLPWQPVGNEFSVIGCHAGALPDFGAGDQAQIDFGSPIDDPLADPSAPPLARASDAVFDFDSTDRARAAYEEVEGWIATCDQVGGGRGVNGDLPAPQTVPLDGGQAVLAKRYINDDDVCDWQDGCDGFFLEHQGVAVIDTRVMLFSWVGVTGNLTDEDAVATRAHDTFRAALDRATGVTAKPQPGGPETPEAIELSNVDIARGLPRQGDFSLEGPSATATGIGFPDDFCGGTPDADALERLAASATGPEYGNRREVIRLDSTGAATTRLRSFANAANRCPPEFDKTITVRSYDLGLGETVTTFGYTYNKGLGGSLYAMATVGPYVVMAEFDGEYDASSMEQSLPKLRRAIQQLITDVGQGVCGPDAQNC